MFQSLGRDSVHSSTNELARICPAEKVSIPRSGFCSFKLRHRLPLAGAIVRFQSLGRDSVHSSPLLYPRSWSTSQVSIPRSGFCSFKRLQALRESVISTTFQSLGRDSVHSSSGVGAEVESLVDVSIPRSGFCSFKPLQREWKHPHCTSFNPSVGILFIQAVEAQPARRNSRAFQSLGRDSVHSSSTG